MSNVSKDINTLNWVNINKLNLNDTTPDPAILDQALHDILNADFSRPNSEAYSSDDTTKLIQLTQLLLKQQRSSGFGNGEIYELEQRNKYIVRELQTKENELSLEKAKCKDLTEKLDEYKDRCSELEKDVLKLRKNFSGRASTDDLKDSGEIKTVKVNRELEREIAGLTKELEYALEELEKSSEEQDILRGVIKKNEVDFEEVRKERDELFNQIQVIARQLDIKDSIQESVFNNLQRQIYSWKTCVDGLQDSVRVKDGVIEELKQEVLLLKQDLKGDPVKSQIKAGDDEINELKSQLEILANEFEQINININKGFNSENGLNEALRQSSIKNFNSKARDLQILQEKHSQTLERLRVNENLLSIKEDELLSVRKKLDQMQKGIYGMKEAMEEINSLKVDRSVRDKNILELTERINKINHVLDDLHDENIVLRQKLGINDEMIDTTTIKTERASLMERLQALNLRYTLEIDDLEEERVRMKNEFRDLSMSKGTYAAGLITMDKFSNIKDNKNTSKLKTRKKSMESKKDMSSYGELAKVLEKISLEMESLRHDMVKIQRQLQKYKKSYKITRRAIENTLSYLDKNYESLEDNKGFPELVKELKNILVKIDSEDSQLFGVGNIESFKNYFNLADSIGNKARDINGSKHLDAILVKANDKNELQSEIIKLHQLLQNAEVEIESLKKRLALKDMELHRHNVIDKNKGDDIEKYKKQMNDLEARLQLSNDVAESLKRQLKFAEDQASNHRKRLLEYSAEVDTNVIEKEKELQYLKRYIHDLESKLIHGTRVLNRSEAPTIVYDNLPKAHSNIFSDQNDLQLAYKVIHKKMTEAQIGLESYRKDLELCVKDKEFLSTMSINLEMEYSVLKTECTNNLELLQQTRDSLEKSKKEFKEVKQRLKQRETELLKKTNLIKRLEETLFDLKTKFIENTIASTSLKKTVRRSQ